VQKITHAIDRFKALAEEIQGHSQLELVEFRLEPPAGEDEIARVEAEARRTAPESLKQFYREANGLVLRWRFRRDLPPEQRAAIELALGSPTPTEHELTESTGHVQLLSIADLLLNPEYDLPSENPIQGFFDFDGRMYTDNEFCAILQPFDIIDDYYCMGFVAIPGATEWKLMLLGDYWIEYDSSRVTWLEDYLQLVIATWGLRRARPALFGAYRGDRQPPLTYDASLAAALLPSVLRRP
jgi:hypothetical protein